MWLQLSLYNLPEGHRAAPRPGWLHPQGWLAGGSLDLPAHHGHDDDVDDGDDDDGGGDLLPFPQHSASSLEVWNTGNSHSGESGLPAHFQIKFLKNTLTIQYYGIRPYSNNNNSMGWRRYKWLTSFKSCIWCASTRFLSGMKSQWSCNKYAVTF